MIDYITQDEHDREWELFEQHMHALEEEEAEKDRAIEEELIASEAAA